MSTLALRPPPTGDTEETDWTALRNFAALHGQLRVSLTPRCNINCWFCHNEGEIPPGLTRLDPARRPRPGAMTAEMYIRFIDQLVRAGLKRIHFTGGEPLASPLARPVLEGIPEHPASEQTYTLITNGLLVRRALPWLARTRLDRVKVSLHYFSDDSLHAIARTRHGIAEVLDGIELARRHFPAVELNTLVQRQNQHEIPAILDYALSRGLPVQFIELVGTEHNGGTDGMLGTDDLVRRLRALASLERVEVAGVGQGRRVFTIDGVEIQVIQRALGRHHVGQCGHCPLRRQCIEGFWALRLDHTGALAPCLLRDDLRTDLRPSDSAAGAGVAAAVARYVAAFTEGTL